MFSVSYADFCYEIRKSQDPRPSEAWDGAPLRVFLWESLGRATRRMSNFTKSQKPRPSKAWDGAPYGARSGKVRGPATRPRRISNFTKSQKPRPSEAWDGAPYGVRSGKVRAGHPPPYGVRSGKVRAGHPPPDSLRLKSQHPISADETDNNVFNRPAIPGKYDKITSTSY